MPITKKQQRLHVIPAKVLNKKISFMQNVFKGYVVIVRRFKSAFERLLKNLFFCPVTFEGRIKKFLFKNQIASKIFL
jgi:hypothetical protein